jgi:hypothetical protein
VAALSSAASTGDTDSLVSLADVPARPVRWLWADRLPIGKLTVLDGDPGLGKSAITVDVAARVSAGLPMPDRAAVLAEARAAGASAITLRRARVGLGIRPRKDGFRGCWLWELPSNPSGR